MYINTKRIILVDKLHLMLITCQTYIGTKIRILPYKNGVFCYFLVTFAHHNINNMQEKRPLILISNDDGYLAGGICQLVEMLRPLADIIVVAPDSGRSGASMSITSSHPIKVELVREENGLTVFACTGSPVDCVKLALDSLVPRIPDLIVSGINHGDNSGINVHYSGTMGATIEGCLKYVPSVAFSSCSFDKKADFSSYTPVVQKICKKVIECGLPKRTCLNVNFPVSSQFNGVRVCRQDEGQWVGEWEVTRRNNGDKHYWLSGNYVSDIPEDNTTDRWALDHGYIAITPTTIDMTDYRIMNNISDWF